MPFLFRRLLGVVLLAGGLTLPAVPILGNLRTSDQVIVTTGDVIPEDLYAAGGQTIVEGVVQGNLVVIGGELIITGTVEGDVVGLVGGPARISGEVEGSVVLAALRLETAGTVGGDVAGLVGEARVGGSVGRDLLLVAGSADLTGRVGRDVYAQAWQLDVDGEVGGNVDARVDDMVLGDAARVQGDVTFRASGGVSLSKDSLVGGTLLRADVVSPVWAKALTAVFGWLSVLGFIVAGVALFWVFRGTTPRAVRVARERPWRSALVGLLVLLLPPVIALPLFLTLVGLPVALLILLFWVVALFMGPVPAVAAAGERLLGGRGGVLGGFVVGALLWRGGMWLLSLAAAVIYLVPLLVGLGAFAIGAWEGRRPRRPAGAGGLREER
jgi:cytoskeletal protein CcmA (bactofilin family)